MFTEKEFDNFSDEMRIYLALHHELYENKCKDVYLEELSSKAFKSIGRGSDWNADCSHEVGRDQTVDNKKISNKSGMILPGEDGISIKISGSRTSKYETLVAKLNFLNKKNYDYILGCGTIKDDQLKRYYLYLIDGSKIDYFDLEWSQDEDKNGNSKWQGIGNNIVADIQTKSTSNQLWLTINKDFCDHFSVLEIDL